MFGAAEPPADEAAARALATGRLEVDINELHVGRVNLKFVDADGKDVKARLTVSLRVSSCLTKLYNLDVSLLQRAGTEPVAIVRRGAGPSCGSGCVSAEPRAAPCLQLCLGALQVHRHLDVVRNAST